MTKAARVPPQSIAARVLTAVVVDGRYLDGALNDVRGEAGELAPLVQEMTYGVARRYFSLNALAAQLLKEPLKTRDEDLRLLLLTGLYQLREMRTPEARAVNETVEAAVTLGKPWARGMINACLRRHQRERARLEEALAHDQEARFDHPRWLLEQLRAAWPDDWEAIVAANNQRPPLWLRVNRQRTTRENVLARLAERQLQAQAVDTPDSALLIETPQPVEALPGFSDGLMSVQDAAAQFAAPLLDAQPGERVLDACAAPGGKSAHLLEHTPGLDLLALDVAPERVARIRDTLGRLGLTAGVRCADATRPDDWWDGRAFDRILLDAPCSASGVIRRHPDVKLRRQVADLARLQATQRTLLESVWPLLKPGGKLLYVTCSVLPDENERPISHFLEHHPDAREWPLRLPAGRARRHGLQLLPIDRLSSAVPAPVDGFYYAGLVKTHDP
ncbi:MAG: 16S rRNA (cytosine(967)-C(5))-methyltransferase [Candidatus Muproteobacteria bacterium RBG_16_64_10]|uniref:16S rRNA (cytosine(967)-C(5))-methyltransferase n=1 Tax=Candidatus Muproteobacteria bacterium RBG_16_64_10 TaxID=1817757 RepID=A0A1F6SXF1_9PROT|nr:MAG: 16S rRNA (cytosine(967)-C(5))-methyltransferase [Candidatus Muproteobacteria bacterium RBG_16_64_10]